MSDDFIEIPYQRLAPELLQAIIEEFITREGTDYGAETFSMEEKVAQIKSQLLSGRVIIAFEPVSETCSLLVKS